MIRLSLALVALAACTYPVAAQDRTPPAGSYDALSVPADLRRPVYVAPESYSALVEGRPRHAPRAISHMPSVHR